MINERRTTFLAALLGMTMAGLPIAWQPTQASVITAATAATLATQQSADAQQTKTAATAGDAAAQLRLAEMYYQGEGLPLDMDEAYVWARKSADQDVVHAQLLVAVMYSKGQGVDQDAGEAAYWYEKAAEQGDPSAQYTLGLYNAAGNGVDQDFGSAAKWFAQAAAQGHVRAAGQLGYLFMTGQGVKGSKVIAFALLTLSAASDPAPDNKAIDNRVKLIETMTSEEVEAGKALSFELLEPNNFANALESAYSAL